MLRDLLSGKDLQLEAIQDTIAKTDSDILVLTDFDFDAFGIAAQALIANLEMRGAAYRHLFAIAPNSGVSTNLDLDENGRYGEPRDAQGYGRFLGDGGLLVLSRCPLSLAQDFSHILWGDVHQTRMPETTGESIRNNQRLSSTAHWVLDVSCEFSFELAVFAATPPVFDGPDERNDRRNADEIALWTRWVSEHSGLFVIAGNANLDPNKGEGYRDAIQELLTAQTVKDPLPNVDTAFWPEDRGGHLRVSYVLPSANFDVLGSGMSHEPQIGAHGLVWTELTLQSAENKGKQATLSP